MPDRISFSDAINLETLDAEAGIYRANISDAYLIASVPNGGYVASCVSHAASLHLAPKSQPHPLTSHFEFIARSDVGRAIITVDVIKPGRNFTTVHATLYQHDLLPASPWITAGSSRKCITAYLIMTDLNSQSGLTLPSPWTLPYPPPAKPDFSLLPADNDPLWTTLPLLSGILGKVPCLQNLKCYAPRGKQEDKTRADLWIRLATPDAKFTTYTLPFVADCLPYPVEAFRPRPDETDTDTAYFAADAMFWYPTLVMNVEVKRPLEEKDGVEWLYLRMQTKEIRNGRLDLEVVVMDEKGELIAVAHHVNLVVGLERNTAGRKGKM
ncbi:thioesterase-like superfamily-domain-containing protein [Cercophora newfieldiana]|uniref:Thioesterase-like superfamily-domain-containing protein n=1 Tax=Cercophora newfieldiana TaxID=92897 RepID=A0AA39XQQ0_9PEZI|nr:thioesterase-like superfamily-domain-containing protein [Cercophora newfieldiana]